MQLLLTIAGLVFISWITCQVVWVIWLSQQISKELAKGPESYSPAKVDALLWDFSCRPAHMLPTHWLRTYRRWK